MGNYKDGRMEQISNAGNGNYFYIDTKKEAEKVFVTEMRATMFTIAKDVKIQVEFNPLKVKAYRLIGYENRILEREDFNDDRIDAGELGAGHTITALYELVPKESSQNVRTADPLKYQETVVKDKTIASREIATIKLRYKFPDQELSGLIEQPVMDGLLDLNQTSDNFRFSAAVAGFGMILRGSNYIGDLKWDNVIGLAQGSLGNDEHGYRSNFIALVKKVKYNSSGVYP
jgi:Ca-activated chloride channel family protein